MRCGISTSCFYPENTLSSLQRVIDAGAPVTELFLNTFSELEPAFVARVADAVQRSGICISSVHPFTSAMEGFFFASQYEGRMLDGISIYRRYFEVCRLWGADKLVFHGDHKGNPACTEAEYAANFQSLAAVGQEYGVALCHENVHYCRLGNPAQVRSIRPLMGKYAAFTLDIKQLRRQGDTLDAMLDAMHGGVRQVHISDFSASADCISPGRGGFDFVDLIVKLQKMRYTGDLIIELYQDGFRDIAELVCAMQQVQALIDRAEKGDA